jgi:hypothetical protein
MLCAEKCIMPEKAPPACKMRQRQALGEAVRLLERHKKATIAESSPEPMISKSVYYVDK